MSQTEEQWQADNRQWYEDYCTSYEAWWYRQQREPAGQDGWGNNPAPCVCAGPAPAQYKKPGWMKRYDPKTDWQVTYARDFDPRTGDLVTNRSPSCLVM